MRLGWTAALLAAALSSAQAAPVLLALAKMPARRAPKAAASAPARPPAPPAKPRQEVPAPLPPTDDAFNYFHMMAPVPAKRPQPIQRLPTRSLPRPLPLPLRVR